MVSPLAVLDEIPFDRRLRELPDAQLMLHRAEVDPSAYIGPFVVICQGLERPTRVGPNTMIEAGTVVGHDATIENDVEIASNSSIGGYSIIRNGARIGMGASIQPYICIGEGARVGSGAVVTKHVMAGATVAGVPAERLVPRSSSVSRNQGKLKCGCEEDAIWDGCPHHGLEPVC